MRRLWLLCFALASASAPALASDVVSANGFDAVWAAGYHVGYQRDLYPTAQIDFAPLSHVVIGGTTVRFLPEGPRGRPELHAEVFDRADF